MKNRLKLFFYFSAVLCLIVSIDKYSETGIALNSIINWIKVYVTFHIIQLLSYTFQILILNTDTDTETDAD